MSFRRLFGLAPGGHTGTVVQLQRSDESNWSFGAARQCYNVTIVLSLFYSPSPLRHLSSRSCAPKWFNSNRFLAAPPRRPATLGAGEHSTMEIQPPPLISCQSTSIVRHSRVAHFIGQFLPIYRPLFAPTIRDCRPMSTQIGNLFIYCLSSPLTCPERHQFNCYILTLVAHLVAASRGSAGANALKLMISLPRPPIWTRQQPAVADSYRRPCAGQDAQAADGLHLAAAARAGEPIQGQQVSVAPEEIRGGHQSDAH